MDQFVSLSPQAPLDIATLQMDISKHMVHVLHIIDSISFGFNRSLPVIHGLSQRLPFILIYGAQMEEIDVHR